MMRLCAVLAASMSWCVVPTMAEAATPPTAPTNVTATVADEQRSASLIVNWTASTDADGEAITYDIEVGQFDYVTVTRASTNTGVVSVTRGRPARITITAVDASGARSAASAPITVTAPRIPVRLVAGISLRGGFAQACAGVAAACNIVDRARASVRVRATSPAKLTDARVQLAVLWRAPGATRFVSRPSAIASIASGSASIPLSRFVVAAGTWCVRAGLAPNDGTLVARAAFTPVCVRYTPPLAG